MRRCAPTVDGAPEWGQGKHGLILTRRLFQRGFTLMEMCIVLVIIALLIGVLMPSIHAALTEQTVRGDSHQLALMVKTAMYRSSEQHRAYVIDFTTTSMALHPAGQIPPASGPASITFNQDADAQNAGPEDVEMSCQLDPSNKLLVPDPKKTNAWMGMPATSWLFQPGELCPAQTVRFVHGDSWLELNFNALTGDVENEGTYFP